MSVLILAIAAFAVFYIFKFYANVRRYPKGPFPLPLTGNMHQFPTDDATRFFEECSKTYGSVFTLFLPQPMVVIMDFEDIKEALVTRGDDYVGRGGKLTDKLFQNVPNGGVILSDGENWREQRRASLHILRDFGMGKNVMEMQVTVSIEDFLEHLESLEKAPVDFRWPLQILVANVINNILFGYHYKYTECERLMNYSTALATQFTEMRLNPLILLANFMPFLERVPIVGWAVMGKLRNNIDNLFAHVREDMKRCMATFDPDSEPECFVHAYMQKAVGNDMLNEDQMLNVCSDFFAAGMETSSTTLNWTMLHLALSQEAQEKIREEIHRVIGRDRLPRMSDKTSMPYTCAAVAEMQRLANIVMFNVPHRTVADTQVAGKAVPEDTMVLAQIYNVLKHSPVYADRPDKFRPERFLDSDGKTPNKDAMEQHVPFGMGRRQCAGEGLARMELFLGLVAILQRYRIEPVAGRKVDLRPIPGVVVTPRPNLLRIVRVA